MNGVISKKTYLINVNMFSSLQTVKFDLHARKVPFISLYKQQDFLTSPID